MSVFFYNFDPNDFITKITKYVSVNLRNSGPLGNKKRGNRGWVKNAKIIGKNSIQSFAIGSAHLAMGSRNL